MSARGSILIGIGTMLLAYSTGAYAADAVLVLGDDGCTEDLDAGPWALYRVDVATGNRTLFSGRQGDCSLVAGGPDFLGDNTAYVTTGSDGSLYVVGDNAAGMSVFEVDPMSGDRTLVSGCTDRFCTGTVGTGASPVSTLGAAVENPVPVSMSTLTSWASVLLVGLLVGIGLRSARVVTVVP